MSTYLYQADNGATQLTGTGNSIVSEMTENIELGMGSNFLGEGAKYSSEVIDYADNSDRSITDASDNSLDLSFVDESDNSSSVDNSSVIDYADNSDNSLDLSFVDESDNSSYVDNSDNSSRVDNSDRSIYEDSRNSGFLLGENASLNLTSMDANTAGILDNAMSLMYANTRNTLEAQAANNAGETASLSSPVIIQPTETKEPEPKKNKAAIITVVLLALFTIYQLSKGRKA